ncbi:hypothetical protein GCM10011391_31040 [Pullulanibacillus camelliae]|uniref:CopC domain-containing protein n=1 Tax=Pullulanibacillus camelliae TaxID=1707096 RepID=A0A8J3E033_9BACL|nr:copper resistance protein CopC [Pullulanibacillus camelliae]GGE50057.1 hypothetical protein GCM10011391_31040 [Pullulanibacillus camelliae]
MPKRLGFIFALLLFSLLVPQISLAHSELVKSTPAQGGKVSGPVTTLNLEFGAAVEEFTDLTLTDAHGHTYALEKPIIKEKQVIIMPKKPLKEGQYKLFWHLIGIDTHKVHGYLAFGINENAPKASAIIAANESAQDDPVQTTEHNHKTSLYITMMILFAVVICIGLFFTLRKQPE